MGGRSKSRSGGDSQKTQATMNNLAKGKVSNSFMTDLLTQFQNSQFGSILPIFDGLMGNANSRFDNHPMMGFFGGQQQQPPQQSLTDIWQAQQPQPQQEPQPPQAPWMQGMTPEQIQAIQNFNGYRGIR